MKQYKRYLPYVFVALATVVIFFVVKAVREARFENMLEVPELEQGFLSDTQSYQGRSWLVPARYIFDTGLTAKELPALNDPKFVSISEADSYLSDDVYGIAVEIDGQYRFYSNQILNWHEVVNDTFGGQDIAVTLSTLTRSAVVYSREFDGETLTFDNALLNYNNNSILKDNQTNNLWLQGRGTSISGSDMGDELTVIPSVSITWTEFKDLYPEGQALSNETGFERDYTRHPYTSYDNNDLVYFPLTAEVSRLDGKWLVTVVEDGTEAVAFANEIENGFGATNEQIGDLDIVALWNPGTESLRVFNREVEGQTLTFSYDFDSEVITDEETDSTWNAQGLAIDGELEGTQLEPISGTPFFWFSWNALWPNTRIAHVEELDLSDSNETAE